MSVTSYGFCVVGFEVKDSDFYAEVIEKGPECLVCGSATGRYCSNCGRAVQRTSVFYYKSQAKKLAKRLGIDLDNSPWTEAFEDYSHDGVLGVSLETGTFTQDDVEDAFKQAKKMAKTLLGKEVEIVLTWNHYISE